MVNRRTLLATVVVCATLFGAPAYAQDKSIVVASTTSTQDSGLFEYLLPIFKQKTGITVKVVAQGTGQALDTGRRGDADVVFVHAKSAEEKFLAEGQGVKRYPVMYNDFVLIGPKSDPAGIKGMKDVAKAFQTIKDKQATFISRGDRSGTHIAELALWNKDAGIDIEKEKGLWYKSIGQGMGAALNTAGASNGYVLSDRGTWIHFKNKGDLANPGRRRQAPVQPVWRHAGEPGQASEREEGTRPAVRRLPGIAARAKGYCRITRSTASNCFTRTRKIRARDARTVDRIHGGFYGRARWGGDGVALCRRQPAGALTDVAKASRPRPATRLKPNMARPVC